ncbi:MAG: hypothetical protein U5L11_05195 [Arhodomonas sp.]|nr:hypothetical protein [Arhodomonas sp.]
MPRDSNQTTRSVTVSLSCLPERANQLRAKAGAGLPPAPLASCRIGGQPQPTPRGEDGSASSANRVFFVSDGTGITAETLGQSLLTQFDAELRARERCRSPTASSGPMQAVARIDASRTAARRRAPDRVQHA